MFRQTYTVPVPQDAQFVEVDGVPSARFNLRGKLRTAPLTEDGTRVRIVSPCWYAKVNGKRVKLFPDAVASRQRLAERKAQRQQTDLADPFEDRRRRPLLDHLADWQANTRNRGKKRADAAAAGRGGARLNRRCVTVTVIQTMPGHNVIDSTNHT